MLFGAVLMFWKRRHLELPLIALRHVETEARYEYIDHGDQEDGDGGHVVKYVQWSLALRVVEVDVAHRHEKAAHQNLRI